MPDPSIRPSLRVAAEIVNADEELPGLLARLLEELPVGIILYDARDDFRVAYANPVMERWVAPENRPLVGRTLGDIFPALNVEAIDAGLRQVVESGAPQHWRNFRFRRPGAEGEPEPVSHWDWNAIPLRGEAGEVSHVMGLAINETDQELVRERLQVSLDLALDLTSSLDPEQVVDRLLERAITVLRADRASLTRVEGGEVVSAGAIDLDGPAPVRGTRWPITSSQFERMVRERKPLVERFDPGQLPPEVAAQVADVRYAATVPLVVEGKVFAALSVGRRSDRAFSAGDVLTMQQIGSVSVLAIRNALLFSEAEAARRHADMTARRLSVGVDLALDLAEQPSPAAVIKQVLRRALESVDADRATLSTVAGGSIVVEDSASVDGVPAVPPGTRWAIADVSALRAAVTRRETVIESIDRPISADNAGSPWLADYTVLVPLILEGQVAALLGASRLREPPFGPEEIAVLQQVGSIAVLAVRNARLLQEAQEASRAKSDFLNLAAHELRTPLSVVSGYLSMLQDGSFGAPSDEWRAPVDMVAAKSAELSDLVRSLLTAARIQAGTLPASRREIDLRHVVIDACARAHPRARMLGGDVAHQLPADPVLVIADDEQLGRALDNLVNNGLTYSQVPAGVKVELEVDGGDAVVTVRDQGIGIEPAQHDRVFERFYRAEPGLTMHSGTGLGLYIARELAIEHGGSVKLARSAPGEGSTFVLRLPLAPAAPPVAGSQKH